MIGVYNYTVILTYISFIFGLIGIYFSFIGKPSVAILCLMISGLCDMFDGKVARTKKNRTKIEKRYGIQIDSLSDLVAFGLLPSAIGYSLKVANTYLAFVLLLLPLCALIRLAYFNVIEEERSSNTDTVLVEYLGLPVTSTAIVLPIIYFFKRYTEKYFAYIYAISLLILSVLFVTKIKIKKLKNKGLTIMTIIGAIVFIALLL